jgi:hypothetical protein
VISGANKPAPEPRSGLLRDVNRLHIMSMSLVSINVRDHRRCCCCCDGKGDDCKSKSDESQAKNVRHLVPTHQLFR